MDFTDSGQAELWRSVQSTIVSTVQSYSETYALNTVVSDLMQLSNSINNFISHTKASDAHSSLPIAHTATNVLLRLLSPIAPSFVEEAWIVLYNGSPSQHAFEVGIPEADGSLDQQLASIQTCAVQVNGKVKFACHIEAPPAESGDDAVREWVLKRVFVTAEGKAFVERGLWPVNEARKVIVANGGRIVNMVFAKK